jgi:hypothetical protein
MSLPSQASQKMKPLFIAIGVIGAIILLIVEAPSFVRMMSSMGQ